MQTLYPAIKPYQIHHLPVDQPHILYLEETGNPQGLPVIVLHSGPGGGGDTNLRRIFDPEVYRIIIFDQRGCGRSTPHACWHHNTTALLLDDIRTIKRFLALKTFILFGSGWGTLLALLYAQHYPLDVTHLFLHRLCLGQQQETTWFYQHGANLIFPDYWQEFISIVPANQQHQLIRYYTNCLQGNNELARMAAAKHWALWHARCSTLQPHVKIIDDYCEPHFALALATLQSHYVSNHYFIAPNQILTNIDTINHLPTFLIHSRYDMIYPFVCAWTLHQALKQSHLIVIRDAGHADYANHTPENSTVNALIITSKKIAGQLPDVS